MSVSVKWLGCLCGKKRGAKYNLKPKCKGKRAQNSTQAHGLVLKMVFRIVCNNSFFMGIFLFWHWKMWTVVGMPTLEWMVKSRKVVRICMNEFKWYVSDETKQDLSCRKQTQKSPFYLVQKRKRLFSRELESCATIVLTYHSPVKAVKTLYSE